MAWTQTDLDAIERAIASGELMVRFADGRQVQYRSMDELFKARDAIKPSLTTGTIRTTLISFSKG